MKRTFLTVAGVAGTAVLIGQIKVGAWAGEADFATQVSAPASDATPDTLAGIGAPCGGVPAPAIGEDLVVCRIGGSTGSDFREYSTSGGVSGYAIGTTSCNNGTTLLFWIDNGPDDDQHPVIAQNLFRLLDGRFEQLGMSWLKHGFCAADSPTCESCSTDGNCDTLQIGCSDVYGSSINGNSVFLGPRSEVNPSTGAFPFPFSLPTGSNAGRLQVDIDDLNPALNAGAQYFGESQYITPDDAGTANANNNNSYRDVSVGALNSGIYDLSFTGSTFQQEPAINAWQAADPAVTLVNVDVPGDGRFILGYKASDNGDGTWHYEYALLNMNSDRSGRVFSVPVGAGVTITNDGFKDIAHHSGDGVGGVNNDSTDWAFVEGSGTAEWSTETEAQNANANALRWGTLYNFRFDANTPPVAVTATIGMFGADTPDDVSVATVGPAAGASCPWDCGDSDGNVGINDFLALLAEWDSIGSACDLGLGAPGVGIEEFLDLLANWGPCP